VDCNKLFSFDLDLDWNKFSFDDCGVCSYSSLNFLSKLKDIVVRICV
jgi:hypothetical protein